MNCKICGIELGKMKHITKHVIVIKGLNVKEILGEEGKKETVRWMEEVRRLREEVERKEAVNE